LGCSLLHLRLVKWLAQKPCLPLCRQSPVRHHLEDVANPSTLWWNLSLETNPSPASSNITAYFSSFLSVCLLFSYPLNLLDSLADYSCFCRYVWLCIFSFDPWQSLSLREYLYHIHDEHVAANSWKTITIENGHARIFLLKVIHNKARVKIRSPLLAYECRNDSLWEIANLGISMYGVRRERFRTQQQRQ